MNPILPSKLSLFKMDVTHHLEAPGTMRQEAMLLKIQGKSQVLEHMAIKSQADHLTGRLRETQGVLVKLFAKAPSTKGSLFYSVPSQPIKSSF